MTITAPPTEPVVSRSTPGTAVDHIRICCVRPLSGRLEGRAGRTLHEGVDGLHEAGVLGQQLLLDLIPR